MLPAFGHSLTDILPSDIWNFGRPDRVRQNFFEVFERRFKVVDIQLQRRRQNFANGRIVADKTAVVCKNRFLNECAKIVEKESGSFLRNDVKEGT